jgi:hypothetical protein
MKALRSVYDFVTGGSIVAPAGLALAVGGALAVRPLGAAVQAGVLLGMLLAAFVASTIER